MVLWPFVLFFYFSHLPSFHTVHYFNCYYMYYHMQNCVWWIIQNLIIKDLKSHIHLKCDSVTQHKYSYFLAKRFSHNESWTVVKLWLIKGHMDAGSKRGTISRAVSNGALTLYALKGKLTDSTGIIHMTFSKHTDSWKLG